jgi:hypothetical protein
MFAKHLYWHCFLLLHVDIDVPKNENVRICCCRCRWLVWSGKMVYRYRIQMTDNVENHSCLCQCSIRCLKYSASGLYTATRSSYSRYGWLCSVVTCNKESVSFKILFTFRNVFWSGTPQPGCYCWYSIVAALLCPLQKFYTEFHVTKIFICKLWGHFR